MRLLTFMLASSSFAALLGQFYGVWTMQRFTLVAVLPAIAALLVIWLRFRRGPVGLSNPASRVAEGACGGIFAALVYDLYRLPFVLQGAPLFKVFPRFGQLLLGADEPAWLVQVVGWGYHFLNGASLGIMLLSLVPTRRWLFWGSVVWGLVVECLLLATPYAAFFGLSVNGRFIFLTASAHLVFGIALGAWLTKRFGRPG